MIIYNKIKTTKRKKLFLLFLRFLKDTHNVEQLYKLKNLYDDILQMNEQEYIIKNLINIFNSDNVNVLMIVPYIRSYTKLEVSRKEWENFLIKKFFNISRTEFIENFFKERKILNEYITNLSLTNHSLNDERSLIGMVSNSFTWSKTKQGDLFWIKVNRDFDNHVKDLIIKFNEKL